MPFPLPGCHRPVAGWLRDGRILNTHGFMRGGRGWTDRWKQNFFAALTDRKSVLAETRNEAHTRTLPVDLERSSASGTTYSGWVQIDDGELDLVGYIVDDAPSAPLRNEPCIRPPMHPGSTPSFPTACSLTAH